jgi:hypothetical protein
MSKKSVMAPSEEKEWTEGSIITPEEYDALQASGKKTIIVSIPTHAMIPYQFAVDLANMIGFTIAALGDQVNIITNVVAGTYIHRAREQLLHDAYDIGCNYMLWLDSDMRFPKDALIRLLAHDEDLVGANYSTRSVPSRFVAIERIGLDHEGNGKLLGTYPDSTGLQEAEAIGFGLVLMKMRVYEDLPKDTPLFWFGWIEKEGAASTHMGEDVWFCRLVREAGYKVYVDHDLSKQVLHCGHLEYRLEHVHAMEEMKEQENPDGDHNAYRTEVGNNELVESD